jgi:hypothetical protein
MALSFPASPSVGQTSAQNGRTYTWSGYAWELVSNVALHAGTHSTGGSDAVAISAAQITSGTLATARLGSGTANSTTYLRGDQTWATVSVSPTVSSYANLASFPATGSSSVIYIASDSGKLYAWTGSAYAECPSTATKISSIVAAIIFGS